jgi:hypothetical protein
VAERERKTKTGRRGPQESYSERKPAGVCLLSHEERGSQKPADVVAIRRLFQPNPGVLREYIWQPPAAPAATEAASVHLARWAPHPSADTVPGTEPSPRMPALVTVPPRQKLVDEATSVKAVAPVADPSSLPVAELVRRRAAAPWQEA